ncbi:MAG: phage portal protein [Lachnospiraceae bacterium]|nr:phage portal protein [Lachnospiraceae bacterium]
MGWLDKLKRRLTKQSTHADMLNGFTPIFSQFGDDVYASDVVQQAVGCIVREMKKLNPTHVRETGSDMSPVNNSVQKVLDMPNELMTTADFLEKITWQLFFNYNCFILPTYYVWTDKKGKGHRQYTGLYPLAPTQVDFIQDASDALYAKLTFANNFETTVRYSDLIHIRHNFSVNEFMGGDEDGQPDNGALLKTLDLNTTLLQGIANAMKSSFAVNAIVKYNTLLDDGKMEAAVRELEERLRNSESGILPIDLKGEYIPMERNVKLVDEATLKFIDEKILRHFGVPLSILSGDYTKAQYEAFYQKTLEPLAVSISQAFTRTLFTERERAFGNKIVLYPKDLIFMSTEQTLEMIRLLGDSGGLYENEKRTALGLRPLPELEGVRKQSLNYVDVDIAAQYQTGRISGGGGSKQGSGEELTEEEGQEGGEKDGSEEL